MAGRLLADSCKFTVFCRKNLIKFFKCSGKLALIFITYGMGNLCYAPISLKQHGCGCLHSVFFNMGSNGIAVNSFKECLQGGWIHQVPTGQILDGDSLIQMADQLIVDSSNQFYLTGLVLGKLFL